MKKRLYIALLIFSFLNGQCVYGQIDYKDNFEIAIGCGTMSSDYLFDGFTPGGFGQSFKEYSNKGYSGASSFSIRYFTGKRFSIGISVMYENERGDWIKNINVGGSYDWEAQTIGSFKRQALTCAPEMTGTYKRSGNGSYRIYTTLGVGFTYSNEVDGYSTSYYNSQYNNGVNSLGNDLEKNHNRIHTNGYYSPFGLRFGKKISGYFELGIGYKGILNGGVTIKI